MRRLWTLCTLLGLLAGAAYGAGSVALFPGVTRGAGANGTARGSGVVLRNPTASQQSVLLELLPRGGAVVSASQSVQLAPGETREIADLYDFLGAADGAGMLRVTGSVTATVRLYQQDEDSSAQEIPAVRPERAISPGEEIDFPYSTPAGIQRDARSNLMLVNLDSRDVTVRMTGGSIAALQTIPAGAFVQIDDLGGFLGTAAGVGSVHAVGDGRWFGLVTTIDAAGTLRRRASRPPVEPPSSFDLIDKALAAGTINAEQALTYKVFADFNDSRLPASLKGDNSGVVEMDSPDLAKQQWPTLSPATRDLIGPFLVPPFYEGSWWDLRRRTAASAIHPLAQCRPWEAIQVCNILTEWRWQGGSHVRVWYEADRYQSDGPAAADLVDEVDAKIWAELIKVMGPKHEPRLDHDLEGKTLLDVVLTGGLNENNMGKTLGLKFIGCNPDPTYILINRDITKTEFRRSVLAHELFHAVQHTYTTDSCVETSYKWLMESTATWFEDELYAGVDREQQFAPKYLEHTDLALDAAKGLSSGDINLRNYGDYMFFFYLTRIRGADPNTLVRNVWEATESADALHALDAGLTKSGAPLEKSWPDFALYNWNRDAPYDLYTTTDRLTDVVPMLVSTEISELIGEGPPVQLGNRDELPHLSIRYYRFDFTDATSSSVAFYNGLKRALDREPMPNYPPEYGNVFRAKAVSDPNSVKGAHVDALVKIGGVWKHEDLTDKPFRSWCRDIKAERLESLIIILSNSDIENTLQPQQGKYRSLLYASNMGCYAWEGSANLTYIEDSGRIEKMTVDKLRFESRPTGGAPPPDVDYLSQQNFNVVSGTFTWSVSGANAGCGWSGQVSGETLVDPRNFLIMFPWVSDGGASRGIVPGLAQAWLEQRRVVKETCGSPPESNDILWNAGADFFWVMLPTSSFAKLSADGKSYDVDANKLGRKKLKGTWHLDAKRE